MKKHLVILIVLVLFFSGTSFAAPPDNSSDVIKHLEFRGYDVSMNSDHIKAKHPKYLNVIIRKYMGGMLFIAYFAGSEYGKNNTSSWLSIVNKLNQKAAAARYYIDNDGDLAIEGYYPGEYSKKSFSDFLDAFNLEVNHLAEVSSELKKYIE